MSRDKNTFSTFFSKNNTRVLMLLAFVVFVVTFSIIQWHNHLVSQQQQKFISLYSHGAAHAAASQLGSFIENDDRESLSATAYNLIQQPAVVKVAIYDQQGNVLALKSSEETAQKLYTVVAHTYFNEQKNGYLILDIDSINLIPNLKENNSELVPWFIALISWGVIFLLFNSHNVSKALSLLNRSQRPQSAPVEKTSQLYRELLRRNQQQKDQSNEQAVLVVKAEWEKLSAKNTNLLINVLNRWLPQNSMYMRSLKDTLLIITLNQPAETKILNQIRVLEACLISMKLTPTCLVHDMDFEQPIYQTFFDIIQPGIWIEKAKQDVLSIGHDDVIGLEIDDESIELIKLAAVDAQQRNTIERQVRHYLHI